MRKQSRKGSRPRRLDGVFFDKRERTLELKQRTVTIEINKRSAIMLLSYAATILIVAFLLIALSLSLFYAKKTRAEAYLYPQTCLGGWEDVAQASGQPDVDDSVGKPFSSATAASVSGALAQIYCGEFAGDTPPESIPVSLAVHLSWSVVDIAPPENVTGPTATSSTITIPPDNAVLFIPIDASSTPTDQSVEPLPAPDIAPENSTPDITPTDAPSDTPQGAPPATPDAAPPESAPQNTDSPQSFIGNLTHSALSLVGTPVYAESGSATDTLPDTASSTDTDVSADATTSPSSGDERSDAAAEVLYSFDGVEWQSLGTYTIAEIEKTTDFQIPLAASSTWEDVSKLQISVRSLSGLSADKRLYLDGIALVAQYAAAPEIPEKIGYTFKNGDHMKEGELAQAIAHTKESDGSTNVIFYQLYPDGSASYMAETTGHGDAPLSTYFAPLPAPGKYTMVEYRNDDGFECNGIPLTQCVHDPHFVARTDFEVFDDTASPPDSSSDTNNGAASRTHAIETPDASTTTP
ncbi:MAG: hypothetical protein JO019_00830 [Candidatus Kaiserbacteria bacterium]|nr:hypothetical protein [Candidatus Kaiserbacteria bacterium]